MTEAEKQAIENLRKILFTTMQANECGLSNNDFKTEIKTYTDILGLVEKQQKELEKYKYLYQKALDNTVKADRENLEKDKIIDEMATTLTAVCTGITVVREQFEKCYCEFINSEEECCWKADKSCKDCIKEYFKKKVEDK